MFAWGMKAGLVTANPITATFKPAEEKPRERVLSDPELTLIWSCTGGMGDHDHIVRMLLLTGARREEIAAMTWGEVTQHGDGRATWVLPSGRSKNHLPHELVLPPSAASLLPGARNDGDGKPRDLIFGEGNGPFSGWSRCKERLDKRIADANGGKAIRAWVLHDLRRTFVTRLNDLGVEPHIIEALVNHVGGSAKAGVAGVYNRSAYAVQQRAALALWCDHVAHLTGGAVVDHGPAEANVVPLRRAG
jgi:integrase